MQCPIDGTTLQMTERSGIEIDYCPQCRGVWLDRGELDKMVERTNGSSVQHITPPTQPVYTETRHEDQYRPSHDNRAEQHRSTSNEYRSDNYHHDKKHHKKENFLGDLFDF